MTGRRRVPVWNTDASWVVAVALPRPILARVQAAVDRRSNRTRYDRQHAVEAFGGRLSHEIDTGVIAEALRAVVHVSLQPGEATLWLR
jgi:hypothetical protein